MKLVGVRIDVGRHDRVLDRVADVGHCDD